MGELTSVIHKPAVLVAHGVALLDHTHHGPRGQGQVHHEASTRHPFLRHVQPLLHVLLAQVRLLAVTLGRHYLFTLYNTMS